MRARKREKAASQIIKITDGQNCKYIWMAELRTVRVYGYAGREYLLVWADKFVKVWAYDAMIESN